MNLLGKGVPVRYNFQEYMVVKNKVILALTALSSLSITTPASAANIILRDTNGSFASQGARGQAALFAFQKAANFWNRTLNNDVTINIEIGFAQLGPRIIAQAGSSTAISDVGTIYNRLRANSATALDAVATANLFPLNSDGTLKFITNASLAAANNGGIIGGGADPNRTILDDNSTNNNFFFEVSNANLRTLGIDFSDGDILRQCSTTFIAADSCITFSSELNFDFDPTDGIDIGTTDFTGAAIHEIGHALGFISGVDLNDFVAGNPDLFGDVPLDDVALLSVYDLFRYGSNFDPVTGQRLLQLAANRPAFFSINGQTAFNSENPDVAEATNLSTGEAVGDGFQASHFKDNISRLDDTGLCRISERQIGILDPTAARCEVLTVTANDLAVLDAIGYNLNFNLLENPGFTFNTAQVFGLGGLAAVPEPATWAMMMIGFGFAGATARRRRAKVQVTYA